MSAIVKKSEPHGMSLVNWFESFGCTIQKMITFATRASAQLENATWASWLIGPWAPWLSGLKDLGPELKIN